MGVKARAVVLWILLLLAACSSNAIVQQGPSDTLRAYARALQDGHVDDAYRLLSDEARRNLSLEAFRRAVKEAPQDAAEIAAALSRPAGDPVVTAAVTMPNGDELLLVYESGRWRIDQSAVELYGQATPRQALLGFLRAFERKRYDVILRYVPDADRVGVLPPAEEPAEGKPARADQGAELTAEQIRTQWEGPQKEQINLIVQAIKAALPTAQIEETGDNAAMPYGSSTVAFLREHGVWKIRDF